MLLRQLKYFVTIVDYHSFTKAAEECYISQSAISQQIQSLEVELGYKLVIREKRTFTLTPAGKYWYHHAKRILEDIDDMKEKAFSIAHHDSYSLRIGYLKNNHTTELMQAMIKFNEEYPDVDIAVLSGTHNELGEKLYNRECDICFMDQRKAFSDEYHNDCVCTQYFYIQLPMTHQLANKEYVTFNELKDLPCIIVSSLEQQEAEREFYRTILGFPDYFIFASSLEEAHLLVASNKGYLPIEGNIRTSQRQHYLQNIPLYNKDTQMKRKYYAFWNKENQNSLIKNFVDILMSCFDKE